MRELLALLCLFICSITLTAQFETEIFPSGIQLPRMNTAQRDSIPTQMGKCIYNTDSQRIECCNAGSDDEPCFWGANSSTLIDENFDTYISTRQIDHGNDVINMRIKGIDAYYFLKDTFYNGRIEIPQNFGNIILGGHAEHSSNGAPEIEDGIENVLIGLEAGPKMLKGEQNILIGTRAGYDLSANRNVMIGYESGPQEDFEGNINQDNVYVGNKSGTFLRGMHNVAVGSQSAFNGNGHNNSYLGYRAGEHLRGGENVLLGTEAGITFPAIIPTIATSNVALGYRAGYNSLGEHNILIGANSGSFEGQLGGSPLNHTLIINSGPQSAEPLVEGRFDTKILRVNNKLGIGKDPTETLDVNGSVKIHNLLKLTPLTEPQMCEEDSQIGNIYLDASTMLLRICILSGGVYKWSELN